MNHLNNESACVENYVYIEIHRPFLSEDVMPDKVFPFSEKRGGRERESSVINHPVG